jgi:MFS family permease
MGVWAAILANICTYFYIQTQNNKLYIYYERVLKIPLQNNTLMTGSLLLITCISGIMGGVFADALLRRGKCSPTLIRKGLQSVTLLTPAVCCFLIPLVGVNHSMVYSLLVLIHIALGFKSPGVQAIVADMAPHFSGTLFGITYSVASAMGFVAPFVVGYILDLEPGNNEQWKVVFFTIGAVQLVGALFFNIFATAEVQTWGLVPQNTVQKQNLMVYVEENNQKAMKQGQV